jgi:ribosomal protein S18 acetylase RimI-like enzyme
VTGFEIGPMTLADIDSAVELSRAEGFRDRRLFWQFVMKVATCRPLVGTLNGSIVATGLATASGKVGWLGGIVVAAEFRRRGYGRAMTDELIRGLGAAGCETMSLESTDAGRPMYERMGFRLATHYIQLQADRIETAPATPAGARVRALEPADIPAICELDGRATAEDRSAPLAVMSASGGWVLEDAGSLRDTDERSPAADPSGEPRAGPSGGDLAAGPSVEPAAGPSDEPAAGPSGGPLPLRGFLLPAERAYGAIVAPRFEDGLFLLDFHRAIVPPGGHVRAGIPIAHEAAWQELLHRGWQETWRAPRMLTGPDVPWRPEWIWGQINSAMG